MPGRCYLVLLAVLALGCLVTSSLHNLSEGEPCTTNTNRTGVCTSIRRCRGAVRAVRRQESMPKLCSYNREPVICCERNKVQTPMLSPQSLTTTSRNSYQIAEEKCKNYGRYAFVERELEILLPTREFVTELVCANTGQELIVGGKEAIPGEFPHMVALGYPVHGEVDLISWDCGGSLISEQFVLTAAHCRLSDTGRGTAYPQLKRVKYAMLGAHNLKGRRETDKVTPEMLQVIDFIKHEDYKRTPKYHDIALIKLEKPVTLGPYIRPACLQTDPQELTKYQYVTATGWGLTNASIKEVSDTLMKVSLQLVPYEKCQAGYNDSIVSLPRGIDNTTMICAGDPLGMKDTCFGDSGGPLQVFKNSDDCTYSIVGVTSFGSGDCVSDNLAGLYTMVHYYVPWIQSHVWP